MKKWEKKWKLTEKQQKNGKIAEKEKEQKKNQKIVNISKESS